MIEDNGLPSDWATAAGNYLARNQQLSDDGKSWDHTFTSAYEMSCEALAALGYAEETDRGAVPLKDPRLPEVLPRWDDVCAVVLKLADQRGQLRYRLPDGNVPPVKVRGFVIRAVVVAPPPAANINAAEGLGPAYAMPDVQSVLQALGLVSNGMWTTIAETICWRDQPREWGGDFTSDRRFVAAIKRAANSMPEDIRDEMDRLAAITESDIATALANSKAWYEEQRAKYGPKALIRAFTTNEQARRSIESGRRHSLDWLFFRRWRLSDGWLTVEEAKKALEVFHDPLAIAMRRAVVEWLYPDLPFLWER
ncbi:hypothetical protein RB623_07145 [Mesorhizobium sp. LHD-90]|uniref:hypothetical protein n=1 Tax=Mesorhizobium sp. LHD-90 TaxID=3071414 RepID=UPI0027DFC3A9|nr:hypothetical protein [Mesorhizobium sp. LHD-90]MDQ6433828.1 hypothetical protein [Mesorhizobium sp. LHD-90]